MANEYDYLAGEGSRIGSQKTRIDDRPKLTIFNTNQPMLPSVVGIITIDNDTVIIEILNQDHASVITHLPLRDLKKFINELK